MTRINFIKSLAAFVFLPKSFIQKDSPNNSRYSIGSTPLHNPPKWASTIIYYEHGTPYKFYSIHNGEIKEIKK